MLSLPNGHRPKEKVKGKSKLCHTPCKDKSFKTRCLVKLLPFQGVLLAFSLRSASSLSFGRGDKDAKSGDIDDKLSDIINPRTAWKSNSGIFIPFVYYLYYID